MQICIRCRVYLCKDMLGDKGIRCKSEATAIAVTPLLV